MGESKQAEEARLKKVRLLITIVSALALGGMVFFIYWSSRMGDGEIVVITRASQGARIAIGKLKAKLSPNSFRIFPVPHQRHVVVIEPDGGQGRVKREVEVGSGLDRWVIPVDDAQCFVGIDVSESAYRSGAPAKVDKRYPARPFKIDHSTYGLYSAIPQTRSESEGVIVLYQLDCADSRKSDGALLEAFRRNPRATTLQL